MSSVNSVNSVISDVLNAYYGTNAVSSTSAADKTSSTAATKTDESSSVSYSEKSSLGRYLNSTSSDDVSAKKIFEKLSIDLGGGGKTITKDQLNEYIGQVDNKKVSIPDEEADVLNNLLDNWDEASDGADEITYSRLVSTGYDDTLLSVVPEEDDSLKTSLQDDYNESTIAAYSKVLNSALGGLNKDDEGDSTFSLIKTLLSLEDKNDGSGSDFLKTLLSSNITSTLELEA